MVSQDALKCCDEANRRQTGETWRSELSLLSCFICGIDRNRRYKRSCAEGQHTEAIGRRSLDISHFLGALKLQSPARTSGKMTTGG